MDSRDALISAVTAAVGSKHGPTVRNALKRVVTIALRMLPVSDRLSLVANIGPDGEFMGFRTRWPDRGDKELELAARYWPYIVPGLGKETIGFGNDIQKNLKRGNWTPTDKQAAFMKSLFREYKRFPEPEVRMLEAAE